MSEPALAPAEALRTLPAGGRVAFVLPEEPLDEVFFALHSSRFTGTLRLGERPQVDRICFREGAVVGLAAVAAADVDGFCRVLIEKNLLQARTLGPGDWSARDAFELGNALVAAEDISQDNLRRAAEEHARRRLFALYDRPNVLVRVQEGLNSLARFLPIYVDIRPAIAFGTVVRSDRERKERMRAKAKGQFVKLVALYGENRNSYGLPPPIVLSLRKLAEGVAFTQEVTLPGLSRSDTLGVLLLFDRMSMLTFRPAG